MAVSALDRLRDVPGRVDAWLQPLPATLPYRAWQRYGAVRGNVLAGGIAYFAFFSVFPALAIGFTVFALVLGNQLDLQAQLVSTSTPAWAPRSSPITASRAASSASISSSSRAC